MISLEELVIIIAIVQTVIDISLYSKISFQRDLIKCLQQEISEIKKREIERWLKKKNGA
jgi:hypothetical protein